MNNKHSAIHIACSVNDAYLDPFCVMLTSLLEHNNPSDFINLYVLHSGLSVESINRLEHFSWIYTSFHISFIEVETSKIEEWNLRINYITKETWFRYFLADMLPYIDKVLYLDIDIIVLGSLLDLYNLDITGMYMAGVEDIQIKKENHQKTLSIRDDESYVNAGVLLLNLELIRQTNKSSELFSVTEEMQDNLKYQDQDVLNIVFRGKIKAIDSIWNFTSANLKKERRKRKSAKIIHFTGSRKPWLPRSKYHHRKLWNKYLRKYNKIKSKKLKVGLLIDEFFGGANTAFGGYGFLARYGIAKYIPNDHVKIDVLLGRGKRYLSATKHEVDGIRLFRLPKLSWLASRCLKKWNYDIYLSIELTTEYVMRHETNLTKKLILWIQDPRPKSAWENVIGTMQSINDPCFYKQSIYDLVHDLNEQNRVVFISQGTSLNPLAQELYRLPETTPIIDLPNPVEYDESYNFDLSKKKKQIVFLGRLEAQKRAWLFCEIAKQLPEYEFYVLGQFHRLRSQNERMLLPYLSNCPSNLHFVGHVDGAIKENYLKESRLLLNTSIWEGIPISWLEALAYGTLPVSCLDRDDLVSRFGEYTGTILGDGYEQINSFIPSIKKLMEDDDLYEQKAQSAIQFIRSRHHHDRIFPTLRNLLREHSTRS